MKVLVSFYYRTTDKKVRPYHINPSDNYFSAENCNINHKKIISLVVEAKKKIKAFLYTQFMM